MATKAELSIQLRRLRQTGLAAKLEQQATAQNFPVTFFFSIASRETNCTNELGDFVNGEPHGVGIIQIDIQHDIARRARDDGSWQTNPDPLIEFGAQLLAGNIRRVQEQFPDLAVEPQLQIAASGYNCGIGRAIAGAQNGDSDQHTTGHDYGRDVMARMGVFEQLIAENA